MTATFIRPDGKIELETGARSDATLSARRAVALLDRNPSSTEHEVRVALSGILCRCTGYDGIVKAVVAVSEASGGRDSGT